MHRYRRIDIANLAMGAAVYEVHVVSEAGGPVPNSFGMAMTTRRLADLDLDTILVGAATTIDRPTPSLTSALRTAAVEGAACRLDLRRGLHLGRDG